MYGVGMGQHLGNQVDVWAVTVCVCVAGGGGACGETRFPRALLHVLHRKGTGEAWEKTGQTLLTT